MKINQNYLNVKKSYLFTEIGNRVKKFQSDNPDADVIKLGIGDVTLPLAPVVVDALKKAADEMGEKQGFRGYGPEQGYDFLREAVRDYYLKRNICLEANEIFISDGAKSDLGNILDLFSECNTVLVPDPVYPVYVDTNIMAGRKVIFADGTEENGFLPMPDENIKCDIIYICSPNNPTGAVYSREELKKWVDYANSMDAVILFDAAYEAFVTDEALPRSIYEIEGAKNCAIEFSSLSKTAGFTGTRCGYTIVPHALIREGQTLNPFWLRRQTTKFNGVSYIIQRGAEAVFTEAGQRQIKTSLDYYRENAKTITEGLDKLGKKYVGGKHSPYIWMRCDMPSWEYFDLLLNKANVVGTPGAGFGRNGEGWFRLTAFGDADATKEAVKRIIALG